MKRFLLFNRKISILVVIAIVSLFSASCSKRAAKETAKAFLQSYYVDNDFEAAKAFSTESTHETLDFKAMMFTLNPNSESESIQEFKYKKMDMLKTKAVCFYEVVGEERRLNLSKIDGKWLVDMPETAMIEPALSMSQSRNTGGFASATSDPIKLKDVPQSSSKSEN